MKYLIWGLVLVALAVVGGAIFMRTVYHDPAVWHSDPTEGERTGKPNDYLVLVEGGDAPSPVHELPPGELLFLFDAIAMNAPRTEVLAGSVAEGHITYVQRSAIFAYPDYISVKSVDLGEGRSALAIWSRSRFGHSDMGVNEARVTDWLAKMGAPAN